MALSAADDTASGIRDDIKSGTRAHGQWKPDQESEIEDATNSDRDDPHSTCGASSPHLSTILPRPTFGVTAENRKYTLAEGRTPVASRVASARPWRKRRSTSARAAGDASKRSWRADRARTYAGYRHPDETEGKHAITRKGSPTARPKDSDVVAGAPTRAG